MNWKRLRDSLTYEEVKAITNSINVNLPEDYCKLIGPINGGALVDTVCNVPGVGAVSYGSNISLSPNARTNALVLYEQFKEKALFPFGNVGNGDYFCFDLSENVIVLYQHENDKVVPVCKSFTVFLNLLEESSKKHL
jgi:hypothetical protein